MHSENRINWLIATALTGWLLYLLAPVLTPFVAAALLAYIGDPLADRLQRIRFPRTIAVVTVFLLTFLFLALLVLLVVPMIRTQVSALMQALPGIVAQAEQVWLPWASDILGITPDADVGLAAFLSRYSDLAGTWGAKAFLSLSKSGGAVFAAVLSLFLIPILTFYLLRDWDFILKGFFDFGNAAFVDSIVTEGSTSERQATLLSAGIGAELNFMRYLTARVDVGFALDDAGGRATVGSSVVHGLVIVRY